jgi:hypothetical protein
MLQKMPNLKQHNMLSPNTANQTLISYEKQQLLKPFTFQGLAVFNVFETKGKL